MLQEYLVAAEVVLPQGEKTRYQLYTLAENEEEAKQSYRTHCSIEPKILIIGGG